MTMHVVLGDGAMTRREITEVLGDIWKHDEQDEQPFWFLLQAKSEPTETDTTLVRWLEKNEIYYEILCDDADSVNELYAQPQQIHVAKKLPASVIDLLQTKPEENEPAEVLALFVDSDPAAAEDRWLNAALQQVFDAGFPIRALNDGLVEIDLSEEAEAAEAEPEEAPAPPAKKTVAKKTVAKKVATPAPAPAEVLEETEADIEADIPVSDEIPAEELEVPAEELPAGIPTRDELEDMEPSEVKEVALSLGIVLPPRTRATTYIDHILGEAKAPAPTAEVTPVPDVAIVSTNGHIEADDIAERVADILWERFSKAFA